MSSPRPAMKLRSKRSHRTFKPRPPQALPVREAVLDPGAGCPQSLSAPAWAPSLARRPSSMRLRFKVNSTTLPLPSFDSLLLRPTLLGSRFCLLLCSICSLCSLGSLGSLLREDDRSPGRRGHPVGKAGGTRGGSLIPPWRSPRLGDQGLGVPNFWGISIFS